MMVTTGPPLRNLSVGGYGYLRVSGRVAISNGYRYMYVWHQGFFFLNFVISSQSGDDPQKEDLAKSGYKLSMKAKLLKHWSIFFGYVLLTCIEETWRFYLNYFRIMAFGNPKRHLIFSTLYFVYSFFFG
jgi:hypothetical protein